MLECVFEVVDIVVIIIRIRKEEIVSSKNIGCGYVWCWQHDIFWFADDHDVFFGIEA